MANLNFTHLKPKSEEELTDIFSSLYMCDLYVLKSVKSELSVALEKEIQRRLNEKEIKMPFCNNCKGKSKNAEPFYSAICHKNKK